MRVGIPKETWPGETRVAVIPAGAAALKKAGLDVAVESGAGAAAGFTDDAYRGQGAAILSAAELFEGADILLTVRATPPGGRCTPARLSSDSPIRSALPTPSTRSPPAARRCSRWS